MALKIINKILKNATKLLFLIPVAIFVFVFFHLDLDDWLWDKELHLLRLAIIPINKFCSFSLDLILALWNIIKNWIIKTPINNCFLSDIATFEGALVAISLPLSLNVVTKALDRYNDQEISQLFVKENIYRGQKFSLLLNIIIAIFLRFYNIQNLIILWLTFIFLIFNTILFFFFIVKVEQYVTNTDKYLLEKFKTDVKKFIQGNFNKKR